MSVCCVVCCVGSGRCDGLITGLEESYRLCVNVMQRPEQSGDPGRVGLLQHRELHKLSVFFYVYRASL
jgi:hypothetical protein